VGIRSAGDLTVEWMLDWIAKYRINEYSDVLGLVITIVGFTVTLWTVLRSRSVASEALSVAKKVRDDLRKVETAGAFASAITAMEEVKRLHRKGELDHLPERYSQLRRSLIGLKGSNHLLTSEDQTAIQEAIAQFGAFERQIERSLASGDASKINFPKMNKLVSVNIDRLHMMVVRLKAAIGDGQ
jgi:hypothetical protein